ncbi:response regulator [Sporomusa acidovorans]|uniref:Alkaline phosphatase synthesis transcriptional regulatory protein PhoP n=1 Tax=Sporomusa acidovorans (strain ATCC 49682 / DSM 3132 / Mol) TaxID=1123286 RepID=A0ABZ3IX54_SPOA4|nr:response regulator transcription factor [Sporomusa acidovorans]OZC23648.1 alkaline phosphatase synthesis transcriptional regulatory protein PhoP [Sporomusa acidovorans DSM 3132]SDE23892.1 two-component system, OmpR family, alkaline phosphatase synthesis response regulator PhoP [Sporomusa acidovorans]
MAGKILIVDDEANIRELLKFNLEKSGYKVIEADEGQTAISKVKTEKPELIVLDLMLPGIDGLEVCRLVKNSRETAAIPIIMLTAKSEEIDKVIGLELGADDYMTKPFSPRELLARIKAVLRRSQKESAVGGELLLGKLKLNFSRYEAYLGSTKLELTPKEYEMLKLFATNIGKVFTREQLLEKVWGYEYFGDTRTVDVHVRHLRMKLAPENDVAEAIETVRGVGYRFRELE